MEAMDRADLGGRLNGEKHWTIQLDWLPACILDLHASTNHSLASGDVPCLQKQDPLARRDGESCSHHLQFHIFTSVAAQSLTPAHLQARQLVRRRKLSLLHYAPKNIRSTAEERAVADLPIYLPVVSTPLMLQHLTRVVSRFD
ncbi:hypothetical protein DPV78_006740 [Talaromyces pinophilus]|nr:hypothetical protein DPV78_006740 [Talaromyces pinophilus]